MSYSYILGNNIFEILSGLTVSNVNLNFIFGSLFPQKKDLTLREKTLSIIKECFEKNQIINASKTGPNKILLEFHALGLRIAIIAKMKADAVIVEKISVFNSDILGIGDLIPDDIHNLLDFNMVKKYF